MRNSLRYLLLAAVLISGFQLQAQKYGHTNFGNVISIMPETKVSDSQLATFQNDLADRIKGKQDSLRAKFTYYQSEGGKLTPEQQQKLEKELRDGDLALQKFVSEADRKVAAKRRELLQPVLEKAQKAVEEVAKEKGYQLIFDTSVFNSVLMADESIDITEQVLAKLGIN